MIRSSRRITSPVAWTVKRKNPRGDALQKKIRSCTQYRFYPLQIRVPRTISAHRFVPPEPPCHQTTSAHRFVLPELLLPTDSCSQNHFCPWIRASRTISTTNDLVPINPYWSIICVKSSVLVKIQCQCFYLFFSVLFKKKNVLFRNTFLECVHLVQERTCRLRYICTWHFRWWQVSCRDTTELCSVRDK